MADMDTRFVRACLDALAPSLSDEEAIMSVEKGQTRYGRQTYLYYRVQIATFVAKTGNSPVNPRAVCVAVNVDTPDSAALAPLSEWVPFP
ncbi:hypothetical protein QA640_17855 [Bradyrhizobium sp. CB82]|uniref:hypothetical protein n=1 Tax=Bradyrhizobium sp. CB82 TaxID=3039159 RepID=UPI0024B2152C|nr:hypothetical protein [Bradyrhizobium sp. CB82]WFU44147.1 hypothetical protein QA640_17855 [Bradyrhizobium sp. CB82]